MEKKWRKMSKFKAIDHAVNTSNQADYKSACG
jgi:hypothetical protein